MMKNKLAIKDMTTTIGLLIAVVLNSVSALAAQTCFDVSENFAKENNVSVVVVTQAEQNGRAVCEVVILRGAANGNRPKREVVYLPL